MKVNRLAFVNYRNLIDGELVPDEGLNIIYGDNGQGKTNLLEALWLFTGQRNFRGVKDRELVSFEKESARLFMHFSSKSRDQTACINISGKRVAQLNKVTLKSPLLLSNSFAAMIFTPEHLSLVSDGPSERRRFIDEAIQQLLPKYTRLIYEYNRSIAQRNALLRDAQHRPELNDTLEVWDQRCASAGGKIIKIRHSYVQRLAKHAQAIYEGLSDGKETLDARYKSTVCQNLEGMKSSDLCGYMLDCLKKTRREDFYTGYTTRGPHRDDMIININNVSARSFASQGQKRSAALTLKLGEAEILKNETGDTPIALLDDVMSELDKKRQRFIINYLDGWQVFITTCNVYSSLNKLRAYKITQGKVEETLYR